MPIAEAMADLSEPGSGNKHRRGAFDPLGLFEDDEQVAGCDDGCSTPSRRTAARGMGTRSRTVFATASEKCTPLTSRDLIHFLFPYKLYSDLTRRITLL